MSSPPKKGLHDLDDYAGFLSALQEEGFDFLVIGGCAVGAYARLQIQQALSRDLDLYSSVDTLRTILSWAPRHGIIVRSRPQPRSMPTAFLEWNGLGIKILTKTRGLPAVRLALRTASLFRLRKHPGLEVLVADPFDLLRNKLKVHRPKDVPHIEVLRNFVEEEIVTAFKKGKVPRERIAPAKRILEVTASRTLSPNLADRLVPLAKTPAEFRFLANSVPKREQADAILKRAPTDADLVEDLKRIVKARRFRK